MRVERGEQKGAGADQQGSQGAEQAAWERHSPHPPGERAPVLRSEESARVRCGFPPALPQPPTPAPGRPWAAAHRAPLLPTPASRPGIACLTGRCPAPPLPPGASWSFLCSKDSTLLLLLFYFIFFFTD